MRVLIVEDDAGVRDMLCRAVKYLLPNVDIVAASDGQLALDAFLAAPANLVISDQHMPRMSGLELLKQLRTISAVPFLMISAEPSQERHALLAGASGFLAKPLSLADLRAAISRTLAPTIGYTEPCAK